MAKLPVCPYCGNNVEKNQPQKTYKNKHYHSDCYKRMSQEMYNSTQQGSNSRQILYAYICEKFGIEQLTPFLTAQLYKFETDYNMTYDGMWYSLKYFYDILGNAVDEKTGIGIIPYVYDKAKTYYIKNAHLAEVNSKKNIKTNDIKVKVSVGRKNKKPNIDITNL